GLDLAQAVDPDPELLGQKARQATQPRPTADQQDPVDSDAGLGPTAGQGLAQLAGQGAELGSETLVDPPPRLAHRWFGAGRNEAVLVLGLLGLLRAELPGPGDGVGQQAATPGQG